MAFSPDGLSLAIACRDGTARFWDIRQGRFRPAVLAHGQRVYAVAYSHDGKVLATGGLDGQVKLWNPDDGRPLSFALRHEAPIRMVAFASDDRTIVTVTHSGTIRLWDARTGAPRQPPATHPRQQVLAAALSPDGRWLATGCQDGWARVWDAASLKLVHELPHPALVRAVGFSPDGRTLLTGGSDKVARLWDVRSGESLGPAAYHQQAVGAVAFSPDGSRIVTGSDDGVCQFRRRRADHPRRLELTHRAGVGVVGISPDGRIALTGTRPRDVKAEGEGEVRLWDLPTGKPLARLTHAGIVTAAIFSADGRTLATAGADGTARLVDVASGKVLCPPLCHEGWVQAIAFDPGGTRLLTGCEDTIARLWDVRSGRYLDRSIQHEQPVVAVAFSPDGTLALTGSSDGCVKLWDVTSGREHHVFRHSNLVETVAFSPDGKIGVDGQPGPYGPALAGRLGAADRQAPVPPGRGALRGVQSGRRDGPDGEQGQYGAVTGALPRRSRSGRHSPTRVRSMPSLTARTVRRSRRPAGTRPSDSGTSPRAGRWARPASWGPGGRAGIQPRWPSPDHRELGWQGTHLGDAADVRRLAGPFGHSGSRRSAAWS